MASTHSHQSHLTWSAFEAKQKSTPSNTSTLLCTLSDGSKLIRMSSKDLISIPIWKGNRILDISHVQKIKDSIGSSIQQLDFGYRMVSYLSTDSTGSPVKESYIVDGQHRLCVLQDFYKETLCEPHFNVVVLEKHVDSEFDVIQYFNSINNSKPIKFSDTNLIVNRYIQELEKAFNSKKNTFIRPKDTKRPYLSADKIRDILTKSTYSSRLKESSSDILSFVHKVKEWNSQKVQSAPIDSLTYTKLSDMIISSSKINFMLGVWPDLPWIHECL